MGIESQAILSGHVPVIQIVRLLESEMAGRIVVRDMQRPDYKIIEFQQIDGSWNFLNLFLESWAADDYVEVYSGPSTFLTIEFSPQNFRIIRAIVAATGGMARRTASDPWTTPTPTNS